MAIDNVSKRGYHSVMFGPSFHISIFQNGVGTPAIMIMVEKLLPWTGKRT